MKWHWIYEKKIKVKARDSSSRKIEWAAKRAHARMSDGQSAGEYGSEGKGNEEREASHRERERGEVDEAI